MAVTSAEEFFSVLEKSRLLIPSQLVQARASANRDDDPKTIARSLARQHLITRWQAGQLLAGRSSFYLGKYRLIELLGRGGMGSVFLGEHVTMNRRVALKIISRQLSKDPASLERFLAEARAVAALDHPNIVRAYSVDNEGDRFYLVMEYVEGIDLQRLVETEGPLETDLAVDYIRQAADGLDHAHQQNLVHCDVKPSNLLVNTQGVVKILDLGLARLIGGDRTGTGESGDGLLGSVDYLAPEQAMQSPSLDCRADVYSLGCTFYFLLTGEPPFPQGTLAQRILKHQTQDPPDPREKAPGISSDLAQLCTKMMAKQPEDRCQTAAEVSQMLVGWGASSPVAARVLPLPRAKPLDPFDDLDISSSGADDQWQQRLPGEPGASLLDLAVADMPDATGPLDAPKTLSGVAPTRTAAQKKRRMLIVAGCAAAGLLVLLLIGLVIGSRGEKSDEPTRPPENLAPAPPPVSKPLKAEPPKAEPPKAEPPKAEPPKAEPPKAEPPKAEPPKAEPPKAEPPKSEPPKAEPPKVDPFAGLGNAVDLPTLPEKGQPLATNSSTVALGKIQTDASTPLQLTLIGGFDVVAGYRGFELERELGATVWWIRLAETSRDAASSVRHDIAKITLYQDLLQFEWLGDATKAPAGYLRNCALLATVGDRTRLVALCKPKMVEPIVYDWTNRTARLNLTGPDLPDTGIVRFQITGFSGPVPKCTLEPNEPSGRRSKADATLEEMPSLRPTFRTYFDFKPSGIQIESIMMWQSPDANRLQSFLGKDGERLAMQLAASRKVLDEAMKKVADGDPRLPAMQQELAKRTAALDEITRLSAFFKAANKAAKLHFRVFNQLGDYQVDLFVTPPPTVIPRVVETPADAKRSDPE